MKKIFGVLFALSGIGVAGYRIFEMNANLAIYKAGLLSGGAHYYYNPLSNLNYEIPTSAYFQEPAVLLGGFLVVLGLIMLFSPKGENH